MLFRSDEKRQSTIQSSTDNSKREIIGSDKIKFFMLSSPTTSQNIVKFNRLELSNMDNNSSSKDVDIVDMNGPNNMIINISGDIDKNAEFFENRYFETSNVTFALLASVEHYEDQKYKESLKWALIANEQDPKSEQSWEMFALSNVKLNKRNDAINALESYLRSNKSVKLERLLNRIKKGELK